MSRDSIGNTFLVAGLLCVVCSIIVSASAVGLRSIQEENKLEEKQKNILEAASIEIGDGKIGDLFDTNIEIKIVDLATGEYAEDVDVSTFDQRAASKDVDESKEIPAAEDYAGIRRRENLSAVYLVKNDKDEVEKIVLPINGKGLWSTMYGFIALSSDLTSIQGLTFYEHGETPGLGGEVDNPDWKAQWTTKRAFNEDNEIAIEVIRGSVTDNDPQKDFKVDGLSGATITSRGVSNTLKYWLGEDAFGPYLKNVSKVETLAATGGDENG